MYNPPMSNGYQINEKDIDGVLNYLKIHDPENATPEMAIALLEFYKGTFQASLIKPHFMSLHILI